MAQTNQRTDGHGDSMTDPAQKAESVKTVALPLPSTNRSDAWKWWPVLAIYSLTRRLQSTGKRFFCDGTHIQTDPRLTDIANLRLNRLRGSIQWKYQYIAWKCSTLNHKQCGSQESKIDFLWRPSWQILPPPPCPLPPLGINSPLLNH